RRPEPGVLGGGAHRELVHVGLADEDRARVAQPPGDGRLIRRGPAGKDLRAAGGRRAPGGGPGLDRDPHPAPRPQPPPPPPPPAARLRATSRACASASSRFTCKNALTLSSTAAIRSRWAWVTSAADTSPAETAAASSAAVLVVSSVMSGSSLLDQDPRDLEPL